MFVYFTFVSSVINLIYLKQLVLFYIKDTKLTNGFGLEVYEMFCLSTVKLNNITKV